MPAIQVVLFDLGGTLLHYEQPPELTFDAINARALEALLTAARAAGAQVPDPRLALQVVGRMAGAVEAKARRTLHASSADLIIREGLDAAGVVLPEAAWDAALDAYYAAVSSVAAPVRGDARGVLARLCGVETANASGAGEAGAAEPADGPGAPPSGPVCPDGIWPAGQGRGLGLVSNTFWRAEMHDADLDRFGLLDFLPVRAYSSAVGFMKPDPRIYRHALDLLDVAPAEAVYVGDRLDCDVAGPQRIGMRAVLVSSPYHAEESADVVPDARIETLDELPALLDAWDEAAERMVG